MTLSHDGSASYFQNICYFKSDILGLGFSIPDNLEAVNIIAVGYSAETKTLEKTQKNMEQFTFFEQL